MRFRQAEGGPDPKIQRAEGQMLNVDTTPILRPIGEVACFPSSRSENYCFQTRWFKDVELRTVKGLDLTSIPHPERCQAWPYRA